MYDVSKIFLVWSVNENKRLIMLHCEDKRWSEWLALAIKKDFTKNPLPNRIKEYYLNLKFKIFPKLAVPRRAALVSSIYLSASQHKIYSCTTPLLRHYYNKYFSYFFIENLLILEEYCRILTFLLIMQVFFAPVRYVWLAIHCIICVGQNISIAEYLS